MHLQSVPELRIDPSPIGDQLTTRRQRSPDLAPNCWLTPEYDALKLHNEMTMLLNGCGGHLEQTYLYLDHSSAAAWCSIAEQEVYKIARTLMPIGRVAERIAELAGRITRSPTSAAKIVTQESNEKSRVVGISLICKLPKPASSTSDVMIMAEPTA